MAKVLLYFIGSGNLRGSDRRRENKSQTAFATFFFRVKAYQGQISVTLVIWVKLKIVWGNGKQGVFTF